MVLASVGCSLPNPKRVCLDHVDGDVRCGGYHKAEKMGLFIGPTYDGRGLNGFEVVKNYGYFPAHEGAMAGTEIFGPP